jgi:hypothetical protein
MKFSPNFFSFEKLEKFFFQKLQGICDKIFLFHFFCCQDVKVRHQKQKNTLILAILTINSREFKGKEDWIILIKKHAPDVMQTFHVTSQCMLCQ